VLAALGRPEPRAHDHGLARDLAGCLLFDNEERAYTGRLTQGRTPLDALIGARKIRPR
jgi:hypothetical protein